MATKIFVSNEKEIIGFSRLNGSCRNTGKPCISLHPQTCEECKKLGNLCIQENGAEKVCKYLLWDGQKCQKEDTTKPCISLIFFLLCRELIDIIFILTLQVCQNQNMDVLSLLSISFIQTGQVVRSLNVIILLQKIINCTRITMRANRKNAL